MPSTPLVVAAVAGLAFFLGPHPASHGRAEAAPAVRSAPDVHPREIVNLVLPGWEQEPFFVENGKLRTFYAVPRDQWFVLTDLRVHAEGQGPLALATPGRGTVRIHLPLLHLGEPHAFDYSSNVGLAFPPGSELGILYDRPDGRATAAIDLVMTGYLRRE